MGLWIRLIVYVRNKIQIFFVTHEAAIAQLGERQTEDLNVPGSIPGHGRLILFEVFLLKMDFIFFFTVLSQYNTVAKKVNLSGPTSFAPLIRKTIQHVVQSDNKVSQ